MDLSALFLPVEFDKLGLSFSRTDNQLLLNTIVFNDGQDEPDLSDVRIVIMGIPESRNSYQNHSSSLAPDEIRRQFYRLYCWDKKVNILDLGNLIIGETPEDTYTILSDIIAFFLDAHIIPIILGGSNDLAYACYRGYERLERVVNIVSVDARFDLGEEDAAIKSNAYLNKIILQQPNYLLNYSNIGYQTYMNSPESMELMKKLYFETYRVGMIRQNMEETEPIVRNAEMMSIDISAVRKPDAPGNPHGSANGFYGEEICQIARYAGLSDNLSSFGIYEYDPTLDYHNQTSQLISHIIWYFVEGYINRLNDISFKNKNNYTRHSVTVSESTNELIFYRSKKSGRWWMIVPIINIQKNTEQKYFLPCSKEDYETACGDKIPERWWRAFQKLNR